jgi:hypothetical protein
MKISNSDQIIYEFCFCVSSPNFCFYDILSFERYLSLWNHQFIKEISGLSKIFFTCLVVHWQKLSTYVIMSDRWLFFLIFNFISILFSWWIVPSQWPIFKRVIFQYILNYQSFYSRFSNSYFCESFFWLLSLSHLLFSLIYYDFGHYLFSLMLYYCEIKFEQLLIILGEINQRSHFSNAIKWKKIWTIVELDGRKQMEKRKK